MTLNFLRYNPQTLGKGGAGCKSRVKDRKPGMIGQAVRRVFSGITVYPKPEFTSRLGSLAKMRLQLFLIECI